MSGQVGQALLDVGHLGPDAAGHQGVVVVDQVHEVGEVLAQAVTDGLARLRQRGQTSAPTRDDLEKEIARQIEQALAAGGQRAAALRGEIASVLKEIDAGGTALRTAMKETTGRVRGDVIAAIGRLSSHFSEMGFLVKDAAKARMDAMQQMM